MKTFVINRLDRPERLKDVTAHLKSVGIKAERFPAIIAKPGWVGCRDSHLQILEENRNEDFVLILEDDVEFVVNPRDIIAKAITELPKDWDCLYLGASPKQPQERYSDHLFRLKNAHTTHAIIWNMQGKAVPWILSHIYEIQKIDVYFAEIIQRDFMCFVAYPLAATQRQYQSDTCRRSDVSTIAINYAKYCI